MAAKSGLLGTAWSWITAGRGKASQAPVSLWNQAYTRTANDLTARLSLSTLTPAQITSALTQASSGDLSKLAVINDQMFSSDPVVRAALVQLRAAFCKIPMEILAADSSPEAEAVADGFRAMWTAPTLDERALRVSYLDHSVRGGGLIENIWNKPASPVRNIIRWSSVPQRHFRYSKDDGEPQYTDNAFATQGLPVSAYPTGKWISVSTDTNITDFAQRGAVPSLLTEFYGRLNTLGWWLQTLEGFGRPLPILKFDRPQDRAELVTALQEWGSAAGLVIPKTSDAEIKEAISMRGGLTPHSEFMTRSAQNIYLVLHGASQQAIVEKGAGSSVSAQTHQAVAKYVITDHALDYAQTIRRDVAMAWCVVNGHPAELTPKILPDLSEPVDLQILNAGLAGRPRNVEVGVKYYRRVSKIPEPEDGEDVCEMPPEEAPGGPGGSGDPAATSTGGKNNKEKK